MINKFLSDKNAFFGLENLSS